MAVTKIHPIKSTLKKALDYIENPEKTEDKMLVSSFGCSYETADKCSMIQVVHRWIIPIE